MWLWKFRQYLWVRERLVCDEGFELSLLWLESRRATLVPRSAFGIAFAEAVILSIADQLRSV